MPHIDKDGRNWLDKQIDALVERLHDVSISGDQINGYINYTISRIVWEGTRLNEQEKYWKYNDAIGILECAKLELYRKCGEYENIKIEEHGSAYKTNLTNNLYTYFKDNLHIQEFNSILNVKYINNKLIVYLKKNEPEIYRKLNSWLGIPIEYMVPKNNV